MIITILARLRTYLKMQEFKNFEYKIIFNDIRVILICLFILNSHLSLGGIIVMFFFVIWELVLHSLVSFKLRLFYSGLISILTLNLLPILLLTGSKPLIQDFCFTGEVEKYIASESFKAMSKYPKPFSGFLFVGGVISLTAGTFIAYDNYIDIFVLNPCNKQLFHVDSNIDNLINMKKTGVGWNESRQMELAKAFDAKSELENYRYKYHMKKWSF